MFNGQLNRHLENPCRTDFRARRALCPGEACFTQPPEEETKEEEEEEARYWELRALNQVSLGNLTWNGNTLVGYMVSRCGTP